MDGIERRWLALEEAELRVDEEGDKPKVSGYGILYGKRSQKLGGFFVEIINPGAASEAIKNADIRSLFNHSPDFVLGRTTAGTLELEETDRGVRYVAHPPDTSWARDLLVSIKRKDITGASFGFRVAQNGDEWREEGKLTVRYVNKIELIQDIGPVTFPAYTQTSAQVRSAFAESGIDYDALAGLMTRARHNLPMLDSDRELLKTSVEILTRMMPTGTGQAPSPEQEQAKEQALRQLDLLQKRLDLVMLD